MEENKKKKKNIFKINHHYHNNSKLISFCSRRMETKALNSEMMRIMIIYFKSLTNLTPKIINNVKTYGLSVSAPLETNNKKTRSKRKLKTL